MTRYGQLWNQALSYPAQTDRALMLALWPQGGPIVGGGVSADGVSLTLTIRGPGTAVVPLTPPNGAALCMWDANTTVTVTSPPASGQSRIDVVYAQVRDHLVDGGANNTWIFGVVAGTPATSNPAVPALPANSCHIAQVTVTGGQAYITQGQVSFPWLAGTLGTPTGAPPVPGGQTRATAQDNSGDWWVYRTTIGTWQRARNAVHTRIYRAAAFSSALGAVGFSYDTVTSDPYILYTFTNQYFLALVPGHYLIEAQFRFQATVTSQFFGAMIYRNGALAVAGDQVEGGAAWPTPSVSGVLLLAAGDHVQIYSTTNAGGIGGSGGTAAAFATFDYLGS